MSLLLPGGGGPGGELGEADRPGTGCGEDVAVGPGSVPAGDCLGERAQDLAVCSDNLPATREPVLPVAPGTRTRWLAVSFMDP
jgi:hypothetical protein